MPDSSRWAIEHPEHKGYYLVFGVPDGNTRPAMWLQRGNDVQILARFYGPKHMQTVEYFLNDVINTINTIHDAHEKQKDRPRDEQGGG
ncbi:MAG TPA: hypothetical protein VL333_13175 [Candidatus Saccharimonadales bacterium]|nr:hypothetical protein [Candidatus Saccharimonadales bacterium]